MKFFNPMPKVLHIVFDSRPLMNISMCRLDAFCESQYDNLRGKYFTLESFIAHNCDKDGKIDYFSYWEGFNIPKDKINKFKKLFRGNISVLEAEILKHFIGDYEYLICTDQNSDPTTLKHELLHAKYSLDKEYRVKIIVKISGFDLDTIFKMTSDLIAGGYPDELPIIFDEIQAYLLTSTNKELKEVFPSIPLRNLHYYKMLLNV